MDTDPEEEFDELVKLAAELCTAPVGLMTLIDSHRQFHKSRIGFDMESMPRSEAFCDHTIRQRGTFVVQDALEDERFRNNPHVTGGPQIRFYAGCPLLTADGDAVGALCVIDTKPRELSSLEERMLRILANQLSVRVQMRTHVRAVEKLALELNAERELFHSFLNSIPLEAYLKNEAGQLLFYNKAVAERFGVDQNEWLGKSSRELWSQDKADQIVSEEQYVLQSGESHQSYVELPGKHGGMEYWKTIKTPIRLLTGESMLANISLNMTEDLRREAALQKAQDELEEANRKLRSLSLTDNLTGLWNRRAFDSHLETEVFRAHHASTPLTLLMIDVDNFKLLNDAYGHSHGDDVLRQVSEILRRSVRASDVAVRFGGEEFAVVMPGTSMEIAKVVCERIRLALKAAPWPHRPVTVSIGIARCMPGVTADDLLKMADDAMYCAKRGGKDRAIACELTGLFNAKATPNEHIVQ